VLATLIGGLVLAAPVSFAGTPAGDSPGLPASTVKAVTDGTADYCVTGYAPITEVSVHNERNDESASIRTNHTGSGCTDVPVELSCGELLHETIVAAGVGADGNPATSRASAAVPGTTGKCAGSTLSKGGGRGDGTGGLGAGEITLIVVGGAALAGLVGGGVGLSRRRRSDSAD
jgi:hypothetical protein